MRSDEKAPQLKKRHGLVAFLLGGLAPGLGLLYAGRTRLAFTAALLPIAVVAVFGWTRLILIPVIFLACATLLAIAQAGFWIASFFVARGNSPCELGPAQRWYWYLLFAVGAISLNGALLEIRGPAFGYATFRISSAAMRPTLDLGDFVLVNTWAYRSDLPERGDIAIFQFPPDPSKTYVKRVIGLPGETVRLFNGNVEINGKPLQEPYVDRNSNLRSATSERFEETVPEGHYFVLGDSRDYSEDSRHWGFVPQDHLEGRAGSIWMHWGKESGLRTERIGHALR